MLLGTDIHRNEPVELSLHDLHSGVHVIGAKQHGKSTLFEHLIAKVMQSGEGLCLLDPHGDLVKATVGLIPENRLKDVILLDPMNIEFPFGLNLYECQDLTDATAVNDTVTRIMNMFDKVYGVTRETPVIAQMMRQCAYTIINNAMTMMEIPLLLTDYTARAKMLSKVTDPYLHLFWNRYNRMTPHDKDFKNDSTINKIDEFASNSIIRNIVGQKKTTISMSEIVNGGKILLVKLPGKAKDFTSLLGSILIAEVMMVALARENQQKADRRRFHLFADEYSRFSTPDFAQLIDETAKYNIVVYIAYQEIVQLDERSKSSVQQIINLVCYKLIATDAERMAACFDCTPPPATKPEPVIPRNVMEYLPKHPSPIVRKFYGDVLMQLSTLWRNREGGWDICEELGEEPSPAFVKQTIDRVEKFLYSCMQQRQVPATARQYVIGGLADFFEFDFYWQYTYLDPKIIIVRKQLETAEGESKIELRKTLDTYETWLSRLYYNYAHREDFTASRVKRLALEKPRYDRLVQQLDSVVAALLAQPIEVYSTEWSNAPVIQQSFNDKRAEIANSLVNLPPYHARVRLPHGEYTLAMRPPSPQMNKADLDERIARIREATIKNYCRPRKEVEEEIRKRHLDLLREDGQDEDRQEVRPDTPDLPKNPPRRPRSEKLA